jgi:fumarate reductase subunit D
MVMMRPTRKHSGYWAFLAHRLSGLGLALFLPLHFLALGTAIQGAAKLNSFLEWTENPIAKFAEIILVILLSAHLTGGLRLLALEFLPWSERQKTWISIGAGISLAAGLAMLFNLI